MMRLHVLHIPQILFHNACKTVFFHVYLQRFTAIQINDGMRVSEILTVCIHILNISSSL
jgi:hypothetical protein